MWGDAWYYEDNLIYVHKRFVAIPQAATTGEGENIEFDRSQMVMKAITYDEMRPGCYERDARVADLALNWTDGSLPFPTFPRFCGQTFYEGEDKELGLACAYNDWMVEEWCGPSGGVNIPLCLIPLWDVELAGPETVRNAQRGVRAICFSELPHHLKLPTIHSGYWDPLFQVCNDWGVTVCMHIGSSSTNPMASPDAPAGAGAMIAFNNSMASLADWLFSRKLIEFPKLKIAYSEGQIGWIPYALERADTIWEQHDSWQRSKKILPEPPSTYYYGGLRLLHRGPPRAVLARVRRAGQHLLRDRLSAHRHDVAALEGLRREDAHRLRPRRGVQGPARKRDQDAGARPRLVRAMEPGQKEFLVTKFPAPSKQNWYQCPNVRPDSQ